ncbi:MAG: TetR/AcrR family transcriptional regulator [Kiritimatiellia bacterium]
MNNNLYIVKIIPHGCIVRGRKSYHHGDLRKALVDAAATLAAEHGPESVSLREVAKRAGVSHAAPYHHFAGKADLLHAVGMEGLRLMNEEMEQARRKKYKKPADRLSGLGMAYIRFAVTYPHYFKAIFRGARPDRSLPDDENLGLRNFDALVEVVQECLGERGRPSKRAECLVLSAWAIVHGMASLGVEQAFDQTPFAGRKIEQLAELVTRTTQPIFDHESSRNKKSRA